MTLKKLAMAKGSFLAIHNKYFFALATIPSLAGMLSAEVDEGSFLRLPPGFYEAAGSELGNYNESNAGDFLLKLRLMSQYDSNVRQQNSTGPLPVISDVLVQPTLEGSYNIRTSSLQLGATCELGRRIFLETNDFAANFYSLDLLGKVNSGRLRAAFKTGYDHDARFNRFAEAFLEQDILSSSAKISYKMSGKTSAELYWRQRSSQSRTEGFGDTDGITFRAAALWRTSPRVSLGPGFRYGSRTGFKSIQYTLAGPVLRFDYKLTTKVYFTSTFGRSYSDSLTANERLANWDIDLNYNLSERTRFVLGLARDTRATLAIEGGFAEITSYTLMLDRKIRTARLTLGVKYIGRETIGQSGITARLNNLRSLDYELSLAYPFGGKRSSLALNLVWQDVQRPNNRLGSWDGLQAGFSVERRF
ncbi:hypothetical protein N9Z46_01630 [Akkermansiaceae bacterium]|nr:hypothetical protein [Akkermansiaceae bacterium]